MVHFWSGPTLVWCGPRAELGHSPDVPIRTGPDSVDRHCSGASSTGPSDDGPDLSLDLITCHKFATPSGILSGMIKGLKVELKGHLQKVFTCILIDYF